MTECVTIGNATLYLGDCLDVLRGLPDASVQAVVTDPPYGLSDHKPTEVAACLKAWLASEVYAPKGRGGFMNRAWDSWVPGPEVWRECLRVLKPGGHMLVFAGTRSQDLMGMALRLAGFECRDILQWVYGQGFPKSLDISKALDEAAGAEREAIGQGPYAARRPRTMNYRDTGCANVFGDDSYERPAGHVLTAPATEPARQWSGYGSALKPAHEPIFLVRKPLDGTVAKNILAHGCGGLNIDATRVPTEGPRPHVVSDRRSGNRVYRDGLQGSAQIEPTTLGRFPPNLLHDGSAEVVAMFPETGKSTGGFGKNANKFGGGYKPATEPPGFGDTGSAARFYPALGYGPDDYDVLHYCPKASKADRDEGLEGLQEYTPSQKTGRAASSAGLTGDSGNKGQTANPYANGGGVSRNHHPTVKPINLMRWLVRLVTPAGGTILDPFMGSGSTGKAAMLEGFRFIGIEREAEYLEISRARIAHAQQQAALPLESAA